MRLLISIFLSALFSTSIYVGSASANKKIWVSTWTNPDGSESTTKSVFYSEFKRNGQLGHYGWSNGRFMGYYIDGGKGFEGKWVQDKSGKKCKYSVDGSFYHGHVWFYTDDGRNFQGEWGYCDDDPSLIWRGAR